MSDMEKDMKLAEEIAEKIKSHNSAEKPKAWKDRVYLSKGFLVIDYGIVDISNVIGHAVHSWISALLPELGYEVKG